jgi:GAF domain-containing protein
LIDHDLFVQALRSFASTMAHSYDRTEMCYELCDRTAEVVAAAGAGVAVADEAGTLKFVTATSDRIVGMELTQEETQQGPCVEAFESQEPVAIDDLATVEKWPGYLAAAEASGLRAVVGFPLSLDSRRLGALNVYDETPRKWSEEDLATISVFADMATAYLVRVSELQEATRLSDQLQGALDSRVIIEQAKGMVANQLDVGVDQAFQILRRHARNNHLRLPELADAVVNMGLRLPEPTD